MINPMVDLLTPALFGLALALIWRSVSTSMATALCVVAVMEMAQPHPIVVQWFGYPIFHGQAFLVFACVALLVVHIRLGEMAAHRVWQTTSIALVMAFLLVSKFDEGIQPEQRVWASAMAQFILIGGAGQVLWRKLHLDGLVRYGLTLIAFPIGSTVHSFLAFEIPVLWLTSAMAALYFGVLFLGMVFIAERFWNTGTPNQRLKRSVTELTHGHSQGVPRQRR